MEKGVERWLQAKGSPTNYLHSYERSQCVRCGKIQQVKEGGMMHG